MTTAKCRQPTCDRDFGRMINGYCAAHYQRKYHGRDMVPPIQGRIPGRTCTVGDCTLKYLANGMCGNHYAAWYDAVRHVERPCSVEGCDRPSKPRRSKCESHIYKARRGIPEDATLYGDIDCPVSQGGAHSRCKALWGSASLHPCVKCGGKSRDWAYDGTDPTYLMVLEGRIRGLRYSRYPEFYMPMCSKCHKIKDAGLAKAELFEYRLLKYLFTDECAE